MDDMPADIMRAILKDRGVFVEKFFEDYPITHPHLPPSLKKAMLYSLKAGGKRFRPVLCLTCASLFGLSFQPVLQFAAAIEMIHTYSLIHDDLPAMDDDDLRRGQPSCHKKFGEAAAILAGDGLLTDAFYLASQCALPCQAVLDAMGCLALAAGSAGMVGGQVLDMEYTGQKETGIGQVRHMQALKTGAMLQASCVCGAILAQAPREDIQRIAAYGKALGCAFQITDDILDIVGDTQTLGKPCGSDEAAGKTTCPSVIGLEKSRELALEETEKAKAALKGFVGEDARFLLALADFTVQRAV